MNESVINLPGSYSQKAIDDARFKSSILQLGQKGRLVEGYTGRKGLVDDPLAFQGQFRCESMGRERKWLARRVTVKVTKTDWGWAVEHGASDKAQRSRGEAAGIYSHENLGRAA